ncbi:location of vulva defective 1-like [Eriocheir sinensis]|uniref:location of vulva defective 1-like n=1 Tax=Eriocheir sinensis TaxID=95602 RepID=UPI0021C5A063|nr:location of vulva defective 1-like [Eriocheir sinensis]
MKNWMTHSSVHFYRSHSIRCAVPTTLGYKYVMLLEDSDFPTTTTIASHLLTTTIPPTTTTTTTTTTTSISATLDIITDTHNSSEESNATMRMTEESIFIMDDEDEAAVTSAPRHEPPPVNASVSYVDVETAATTDIHHRQHQRTQHHPDGCSILPKGTAPSPRQPTPTTTPTNAPRPPRCHAGSYTTACRL